MEQRLNKLEIQGAVNQERYETLVNKIDDMPEAIVNKVRLIMIDEARKTSDGLGIRIDKIEGKLKYVAGFGAGIGLALNYLFHLLRG